MAVNLNIQQICNVTELFSGNAAQGNVSEIAWSALNVALNLNANTNPPVSKVAGGAVALVAGVKTLDLTALTSLGSAGSTVSLTGLKVVAILIYNPSTHSISMTVGASSGYDWGGTGAASKITLQPGASTLIYTYGAAPTVASGVKNLDFAGTTTDTFDILIVAG